MGTLLNWLRLVRLPNVFTAPGDPLAGILLASATAAVIPWRGAILVCLASCCFYMGGMILNDIADVKVDQAERPNRPLPSGAISVFAASNGVGAFFLIGLCLCWLVSRETMVAGLILISCIALYNLAAKSVLVFGPLSMGLCRGVNVMLGATAVAESGGHAAFLTGPVTGGFYLIFLYIAMVTMLARDEMTDKNPIINRWLPLGMLVSGFLLLIATHVNTASEFYSTASGMLFLVMAATAIYFAWDAGHRMGIAKRVPPPLIGKLIGNLLFIQSALILFAGHIVIGLGILLFWPLNKWLRRKIAAS